MIYILAPNYMIARTHAISQGLKPDQFLTITGREICGRSLAEDDEVQIIAVELMSDEQRQELLWSMAPAGLSPRHSQVLLDGMWWSE